MKKIIVFLSLWLLVADISFAQSIQWQNTIGGSGSDKILSILQTNDGGYMLGGHSESNISGDKTENSNGVNDCWIVKTDSIGNIMWQNTIGGNNGDYLRSIKQTADGGYIFGGDSYSNISGDKTENCIGVNDFWIVKIDSIGNIIWQNTIGGSAGDLLNSLGLTSDGGYILGGQSLSNISGDKTENSRGLDDLWIVKIDSLGNIQWQNTIGGSANDRVSSIEQTTDGGYVIAAASESGSSGDKTENSAGWDFWIVKTDASGNIQWQNTIGGSVHDWPCSIQQTIDGGYILGGVSTSGISGDKTENNWDTTLITADYWILKTDSLANIQWQNTIGGVANDLLSDVKQTADGRYILGGYSRSNISGDKAENCIGSDDYWVLNLDTSGNILWQNTIGGTGGDQLHSIQPTTDGNYILGGRSLSNISGDKSENCLGNYDYWIIKITDSLFCPVPSAVITPPGTINICSGSNQILSASAGPGYTWQWKKNGTDISGATNSTYTVTAAGSYTVVVTNSCGSATSAPTAVTVNSLPNASITAAGPTTFCSGGSVTLNSVVTANRTYQWKKSGVNLAGATSASYIANASGTYKVTVTNTLTGCTKTSGTGIAVTKIALPSAVITPQGPTTFCAGQSVVLAANTGAGLAYKWKKNGNYISLATNANYTATTAGNYRVEVTNSSGCSKTSSSVTVTVPCREGANISNDEFNVTVSPNPSSGDFVFEMQNAAAEKFSIDIYDMAGKLILSETIHNSTFIIHNLQLVPGVYSAMVTCGEKRKVLRIVKKN